MHLIAGSGLSLEWSRVDNFDPFYGGSNSNTLQMCNGMMDFLNEVKVKIVILMRKEFGKNIIIE